jgi:cation diffusion facilitator family transporter
MAASSKKVIYAALAGNMLIAATKFLAALITGSSAMLSEGVHSVVDTGNQILLLYGMRAARQPADEQFPFGHGKEVYFWTFVVAVLIFAVGAGVSTYEGVRHILRPRPIENPAVNYVVLGLALLFEGATWLFAFREFSQMKGRHGYIEAIRRGKDPTAFAVLFEDSAALLGLGVALAGVSLYQVTGHHGFDGAASILIGLLLGGTAVWLAYESKGLLIGESANSEVVRGIRRIAQSFELVDCVNEVLTMHMGPEFILVNLSVHFTDAASSAEVEESVARLDGAIKRVYPNVKRVFVEAEPRRVGGAGRASEGGG